MAVVILLRRLMIDYMTVQLSITLDENVSGASPAKGMVEARKKQQHKLLSST